MKCLVRLFHLAQDVSSDLFIVMTLTDIQLNGDLI